MDASPNATGKADATVDTPASLLALLDVIHLPTTSSSGSSSNSPSRPQSPRNTTPFVFGSRFLDASSDPMAHNAWDHVDPDEEYTAFAASQITSQRSSPVSAFDRARFNSTPAKWWDRFYTHNAGNFFKDRKWLINEFPIIADLTSTDRPVVVVELGCGAGNTLFPILEQNQNPNFRIHGCDFSRKAVDVVRAHQLYADAVAKGNVRADVYDLASPDELPEGVQPGSVDVVLMVFVFSALAPSQWAVAINNVRTMLKPGGKVLFRDYGRGDLAQVRFKAGRYLEENFYVRGDGTRVYFFEESELKSLFTGEEMDEGKIEEREKEKDDGTIEIDGEKNDHIHRFGGFKVETIGLDKRMLVNRKRQIKMYRRWLQAVFEKL